MLFRKVVYDLTRKNLKRITRVNQSISGMIVETAVAIDGVRLICRRCALRTAIHLPGKYFLRSFDIAICIDW
jgi:hypothetical protein